MVSLKAAEHHWHRHSSDCMTKPICSCTGSRAPVTKYSSYRHGLQTARSAKHTYLGQVAAAIEDRTQSILLSVSPPAQSHSCMTMFTILETRSENWQTTHFSITLTQKESMQSFPSPVFIQSASSAHCASDIPHISLFTTFVLFHSPVFPPLASLTCLRAEWMAHKDTCAVSITVVSFDPARYNCALWLNQQKV